MASNYNGGGGNEMDEKLKQKFITDLSAICSIDEAEAIVSLEKHNWDIQAAIDAFLDNDGEGDGEDNNDNNQEFTAAQAVSPEIRKEANVETEVVTNDSNKDEDLSNWAPESLSIMSWNLDGLDEKNLSKRIDAVVKIVEKEKHDVLFFQELVPETIQYLILKLQDSYRILLGTDDPLGVGYFTATFLRYKRIYYESHRIFSYPTTSMGRTLLTVKCFMGRSKFCLLNTHLESTSEFAEERVRQLKICFDRMQETEPEYNVIFGGDLNARDKEVNGIIPGGVEDLWIKLGARETCKYTWDLTRNTNKQMPNKWQPRCRFDRFYFKNSTPKTIKPEFFALTGIERVPQTQSFPSDHWAIISFFKLDKEARKPLPKKRKVDNDNE